MSCTDPDIPVSDIRAANPAQVPQRSPLRYPGGKTWLVPHIRSWLRVHRPETLIEPFAGGATASLTAVMEHLAQRASMTELDPDVASFWTACLDQGEALARQVLGFAADRDSVLRLLETGPGSGFQAGFRALVLNRFRCGGVMADGASLIRDGDSARGAASRWYPETLARRIRAVHAHAPRIGITCGDGMQALVQAAAAPGGQAAFIDPPYSAPSGKQPAERLYRHWQADFAAIFAILSDTSLPFLLTCEDCPHTRKLAAEHGFAAVLIPMKTGRSRTAKEMAVTRTPDEGI